MKIQFRSCLLTVVAAFAIFDSAYGSEIRFCKKLFGSKVETSFEPKEFHRGGVAENIMTGKASQVRIEEIKKPTGFVCVSEIDKDLKDKCPNGLEFDLKRNEFPSCVSKVFRLKELCPDEIGEAWPDMKLAVCRNGIKQHTHVDSAYVQIVSHELAGDVPLGHEYQNGANIFLNSDPTTEANEVYDKQGPTFIALQASLVPPPG